MKAGSSGTSWEGTDMVIGGESSTHASTCHASNADPSDRSGSPRVSYWSEEQSQRTLLVKTEKSENAIGQNQRWNWVQDARNVSTLVIQQEQRCVRSWEAHGLHLLACICFVPGDYFFCLLPSLIRFEVDTGLIVCFNMVGFLYTSEAKGEFSELRSPQNSVKRCVWHFCLAYFRQRFLNKKTLCFR